MPRSVFFLSVVGCLHSAQASAPQPDRTAARVASGIAMAFFAQIGNREGVFFVDSASLVDYAHLKVEDFGLLRDRIRPKARIAGGEMPPACQVAGRNCWQILVNKIGFSGNAGLVALDWGPYARRCGGSTFETQLRLDGSNVRAVETGGPEQSDCPAIRREF